MKKIHVENNLKQGAQLLLTQLKDPNAYAQCQTSVEESNKRLAYLQESLRRLQAKKQGKTGEATGRPSSGVDVGGGAPGNGHAATTSVASTSTSTHRDDRSNIVSPVTPTAASSSSGGIGAGFFSLFKKATSKDSLNSSTGGLPTAATGTPISSESLSQLHTPSGSGNNSPALQHRESFTNIDLIKSESGLSAQKIALKLYEIAYKLDVEQKVKHGTDRLSSLYAKDATLGRQKVAKRSAGQA